MTKDIGSKAYIGVGCNKSALIMDWSENNLICFGACNAVAIFDPECGKIISTFVGHKSIVTCVKWIRGQKNRIVSGSSDSSVIVWSFESSTSIGEKSSIILAGHKESILAVDGISSKDKSFTVVVTAAADNTVRIWAEVPDKNEFSSIKEISMGYNFALCLNLLCVSETNNFLLAIGTDNPHLLFYSVGESESSVVQLAKTSGHEDWIRCVDMTVLNDGDIFIATSGQDNLIRVMRLSNKSVNTDDGAFSVKKQEIHINGATHYLSLETVLYGHEGWVYSVMWSPSKEDSSPQLLSASFDRTLVVWEPCPDTGVWLENARMGELGGDNSLGYYGAKFNPDGTYVLAHSYQGSFHLWKKEDTNWTAEFFIGGHVDAVTDLAWERKGRYLITVSSDKTTRLHAPCLKGTRYDNPWCELSRPQIHGHALYSVTSLNDLGFASCSEEKVIRVFLPSAGVLKLLNHFSDSLFEKELLNSDSLPASASITALGLSNKANFESSISDQPEVILDPSINSEDKMSPNEDFLVQHTLWPEVMKLYGHGNDVYTATASRDGTILASASKATTPEQAQIILWDTKTWNILAKLDGHQLTVTQMAFSPDDSYLLSVSRDRKWCLFKKEDGRTYTFHSTSKKGEVMHSRIIWTCAWSHDSKFFATGSREGKVIIWDVEKPISSMVSSHGSVTALDFGPAAVEDEKYILAIGHESGLIQIYKWKNDLELLNDIPSDFGHHLTVKRLQFRPLIDQTTSSKSCLQLASCSDDHSVRVFDIDIS